MQTASPRFGQGLSHPSRRCTELTTHALSKQEYTCKHTGMRTAGTHLTASDQERLLTWLRLARVFQRADQLLTEQVRQHGLSMAQFDVLAQVGAVEGRTQQSLADTLLVTKGNIAQLLDRMERLDLVERRPSGTGRANRLYLTEAGRARRAEVIDEHERLAASLFDRLDDDRLATLRSGLRTVDHTLRSRATDPPNR